MSKKSVDVKRVGPALVAAFHRADPPLVWRFDLERNHSFTLALQGEDGDWELGITSPKGEFYPVTRFAEHEDAEEALHRVERVLAKTKISWVNLFFKSLIGIVVLGALAFIGVFVVIGHNTSRIRSMVSDAPMIKSQTSSALALPPAPMPSSGPNAQKPPIALQPGIPQAADDVLKPPQ